MTVEIVIDHELINVFSKRTNYLPCYIAGLWSGDWVQNQKYPLLSNQVLTATSTTTNCCKQTVAKTKLPHEMWSMNSVHWTHFFICENTATTSKTKITKKKKTTKITAAATTTTTITTRAQITAKNDNKMTTMATRTVWSGQKSNRKTMTTIQSITQTMTKTTTITTDK